MVPLIKGHPGGMAEYLKTIVALSGGTMNVSPTVDLAFAHERFGGGGQPRGRASGRSVSRPVCLRGLEVRQGRNRGALRVVRRTIGP